MTDKSYTGIGSRVVIEPQDLSLLDGDKNCVDDSVSRWHNLRLKLNYFTLKGCSGGSDNLDFQQNIKSHNSEENVNVINSERIMVVETTSCDSFHSCVSSTSNSDMVKTSREKGRKSRHQFSMTKSSKEEFHDQITMINAIFLNKKYVKDNKYVIKNEKSIELLISNSNSKCNFTPDQSSGDRTSVQGYKNYISDAEQKHTVDTNIPQNGQERGEHCSDDYTEKCQEKVIINKPKIKTFKINRKSIHGTKRPVMSKIIGRKSQQQQTMLHKMFKVCEVLEISSARANTPDNVATILSEEGAEQCKDIVPISPEEGSEQHKDVLLISPEEGSEQHKDVVPISPEEGSEQHKDVVPISPEEGSEQHEDVVPISPEEGPKQCNNVVPISPEEGAKQQNYVVPILLEEGVEKHKDAVPILPDEEAEQYKEVVPISSEEGAGQHKGLFLEVKQGINEGYEVHFYEPIQQTTHSVAFRSETCSESSGDDDVTGFDYDAIGSDDDAIGFDDEVNSQNQICGRQSSLNDFGDTLLTIFTKLQNSKLNDQPSEELQDSEITIDSLKKVSKEEVNRGNTISDLYSKPFTTDEISFPNKPSKQGNSKVDETETKFTDSSLNDSSEFLLKNKSCLDETKSKVLKEGKSGETSNIVKLTEVEEGKTKIRSEDNIKIETKNFKENQSLSTATNKTKRRRSSSRKSPLPVIEESQEPSQETLKDFLASDYCLVDTRGRAIHLFDEKGFPLTDGSGRPLRTAKGELMLKCDENGIPIIDEETHVFDMYGRQPHEEGFQPWTSPKILGVKRLSLEGGHPLILFDIEGKPLTSVSGTLLVDSLGRNLLNLNNCQPTLL